MNPYVWATWSRRQISLRIGTRSIGIRSNVMREYYSERNRIGWHVLYLPFGWRAFYRKDPS